jgi:hypothetical protein
VLCPPLSIPPGYAEEGASISINRLQVTAYSARPCLAVRRNSSHRIPDESGEDSEDIL